MKRVVLRKLEFHYIDECVHIPDKYSKQTWIKVSSITSNKSIQIMLQYLKVVYVSKTRR